MGFASPAPARCSPLLFIASPEARTTAKVRQDRLWALHRERLDVPTWYGAEADFCNCRVTPYGVYLRETLNKFSDIHRR